MTYQEIINTVSREVNLPSDIVDKTYKAFFSFIRESIKELPLKEDLSEEDFNKYKTNFNIPSLGKLTCTYDRMCKVKKRFEYLKGIKTIDNEHKEN